MDDGKGMVTRMRDDAAADAEHPVEREHQREDDDSRRHHARLDERTTREQWRREDFFRDSGKAGARRQRER